MKSDKKDATPPRIATRFLRWYCKPMLLEDLEGDLMECFIQNQKDKGLFRAKIIYAIDVLVFLKPYTMRKISLFKFLVQWMMLGSYFKTSGRNLLRNKLFSSINIIGLAVSMSAGLLTIAFISDFLSYDTFFKNKEKIFRVNSEVTSQYGQVKVATTSFKLGKDLLETGTGFEQLAILGNGFGGDALVGDTKIPIGGMWASKSFFSVFSFSLIHGSPTTALSEPYSLVLSEKIALKLFNSTDVVGKSVKVDTTNYFVTGVMKNPPKFSHLRPEVLASLSTREVNYPAADAAMLSWNNIYSYYVYALTSSSDPAALNACIDRIAATESKSSQDAPIKFTLQPLNNIVLAKIGNAPGATFPVLALWIMGGLALIVIVSACFNYTNLSIARAIRRGREVGIRKVIGASTAHVLGQFIAESVILALVALAVSFGLFIFLRQEFLALNPFISNIVSLEISPMLVVRFLAMSLIVGVVAGFVPALFFSRINAVQVLKGSSSLKIFKTLSLRKALIVVQYGFSLIFISTTLIGYHQYKGFVEFDLGFKTENILNIAMQGNANQHFKNALVEILGVDGISVSRMVSGTGSLYGAKVFFNDKTDSTNVTLNAIDENYITLHRHVLVAGRDFQPAAADGAVDEVIVTEKFLRDNNIAGKDPWKSLGQVIFMDKTKKTIVGVVKDFAYTSADQQESATIFSYSKDEPWGYLNININSKDILATVESINAAWKKNDPIHPINAVFYDDAIERNYSQFMVMVKVIGFLSFLAICIASMGLFGMVVFTTETRLREISIRKVLGAGETKLIFLLSRGFIGLLVLAAGVALPLTYILFDKVVLISFTRHDEIRWSDMIVGFTFVALVAILMIVSQTLKAARSNPADVLKNE